MTAHVFHGRARLHFLERTAAAEPDEIAGLQLRTGGYVAHVSHVEKQTEGVSIYEVLIFCQDAAFLIS